MDTITFEQMQQYEHDENVLIIDVREPDEIKNTGLIGDSINIPLSSLENALKKMSEADFLREYGKSKPENDSLVIFTCKLGGRATKAGDIAKELGLNKVGVYKGSWTEWSQKLNLV
ncbi:rhodanese domain-containing protein CG4456 [Aethina tumida]|uniref:rhodanese domain-containing protein CG4456 n=1 Tax=Aethina tumida TaxID=116153 RepID=UPI00096B59A4|nr:rhodanese domain-containing protein CG4456 [Aethina tumida]